MSHQAGAGPESPGQYLSVADRRDRDQSAFAEGEERSTSVALSLGQLRGTAGRHRRSARGDHWGTNTRGDCWGVRLSGGTPRFQTRPGGGSALGCGLLAGAEQVRAVAPGPGSALTLHANDIASRSGAARHPALSTGAHVQLRWVRLVSRVVPRFTYSTVLMQLRNHAHRTDALRDGGLAHEWR